MNPRRSQWYVFSIPSANSDWTVPSLSELEKGRVAGPFLISPIPNLHVSRFGVIPKKHQPGMWRLILDLSSPLGHSVNDGILKELFSVQYMRVDDVISGIMSFGWATLLAKFDVESAYWNIPVHPEDRYLFGTKWQGNYFIDIALPFGLCSAPFIFSSVSCRFARVDPQTQLWLEFPLALSWWLLYIGSSQLSCLPEQPWHMHPAL